MAVDGRLCMGLGGLFSFVALILLIMVNVAQINPGKVSRSISMVNMNVSALGASLQQATGDPSVGLFNSTAWTIGQGHGLQPWYSWGLYGVCGYPLNNTFQGGCSNTSLAHAFTPFDVIVNDTPTKYNFPVTYFISNSNGVETFINSGYFTSISHVAFYPLFIATIAVALAFFIGLFRSTATFAIATILIIISAIFVLITNVLWSTMIKKAKTINTVRSNQNIALNITVSQGNGPLILWAVFALLIISLFPYFLVCRTFRRWS